MTVHDEPGALISDTFMTLKRVSKYFAAVHALDNIDLAFQRGEVHCLVGKNGCGKSTLLKIIAGVCAPEVGAEIILQGKTYSRLRPKQSIEQGIAVIYQDLSLFPNLTVAENIAIHDHIAWSKGLVQRKRLQKIARNAMEKVGIALPLEKRVEQLSTAQCQLVAICRAMAADARLTIMDEPTASLTRVEVRHLLEVVSDLKARGLTVVFVSHKLDEVMEVSDRVTVLRDGRVVGTYPAGEIDTPRLAHLMTGEHPVFTPLDAYHGQGKVKLEVKNLTKQGQFDNISFTVRGGEILSITGLLGAGRTELCLALFGMTKADSGKIIVNGREAHFKSNRDAIQQGIGYLSEDRMNIGLVMAQSIYDNMIACVLPKLKKYSFFLDHMSADAVVEELLLSLQIQASDPHLPVSSLSGGNAQRVAIAKWIAAELDVLILDSPTIGVDVANKIAIYTIVKALAAQGIAIIMVSDEISEVFYNTHRVIVMQEGRFIKAFKPVESSPQEIIEAVNA